jgi:hypothetical protein
MEQLAHRYIPHLLRPYCERNKDDTVRIVILVFFNNSEQIAVIKFERNLSNKGQDMFYALIFNHDAVKDNIEEYRKTESKRIKAATKCAVVAAERMLAMSDTATATEYEMATLIVKRAAHNTYTDALVANPPKTKADGCYNTNRCEIKSGNECSGCACTCGIDNGCEDYCAVCMCGEDWKGCDGCNVEHCCQTGMCGYDLTQCNRTAHPNSCGCSQVRLSRNVNKYYEDAIADMDAHATGVLCDIEFMK